MWEQFIQASKVVGVGLIGTLAVLFAIGLFTTPSTTLTVNQRAAVQSAPPVQEVPTFEEEVPSEESTVSEEIATETAEPLTMQPPVPTPPVVTIIPPEPPRYTIPPLPLDAVTNQVLPSLVNILCLGRNTPFTGASGSGIIIDSRGVILTNAHVAQYFLLEEILPENTMHCTIRTGAPAKERYTAELVYLPQKWAEKHAGDLLKERPTGTGEHDWALLRVAGRTDGSSMPATFPSVPVDTREHIARADDQVLLSSYPAGFLGGIALRKNLWPASTITNIKDVFTFKADLVDILSLGGTIVAQSGSSGGAVVNQWGRLVGIIVTSTLGETTDERDLRAVTLSHIERSIFAHTKTNLAGFLDAPLDARVENFRNNIKPYVLEHFHEVLQ